MEFQKGDIILLARKGHSDSIYGKLQRFFTKQKWTHSAIIVGDILDETSVLSANELVVIEPLQRYFNEDCDIEVYRPIRNDYLTHKVINSLYKRYSSKYYGFLQITWFVYRWFKKLLQGPTATFKKNIFTNGIICSELVFKYMEEINHKDPYFNYIIKSYDPDAVHVGDIRDILINYNEYFELIYSRTI